jgi:hypothetical protein
MINDKLYRIAKLLHGSLNRDAVHDMYCKFGDDLPNMAYLSTCLSHAKPLEIQQKFEIYESDEQDEDEDFESVLSIVSSCVNTVRDKYELEVDTFLECCVNGTYKSFEARSGISRSVLEKICKFAKYEISKEFNSRLG